MPFDDEPMCIICTDTIPKLNLQHSFRPHANTGNVRRKKKRKAKFMRMLHIRREAMRAKTEHTTQ